MTDKFDRAVDAANALQAAVSRLEQGLKKDGGTEADRWYAAGQIHEIANELNEAESAYRGALASDPKHHAAAGRLAVVLITMGRLDAAIEVAGRVVTAESDFVMKSLVRARPLSICSILGDAYRISGNLTAANVLYSEAAKTEGKGRYGRVQAALTAAALGHNQAGMELASRLSGEGGELKGLVNLLSQRGDDLPNISELASDQFVMAAEMTNAVY